MRRMHPLKLLTVIALLAQVAGQDGALLRWQFKTGDVLRYRMSAEQSTEMPMMSERPMENTTVYVLREDVKDVAADGTASIDVGYEAMRMDMDIGVEMSFDSTLTGDAAKANDPTLSKMLAPMLETKLHLKMEPSGRVSEISGLKEMLAKTAENLESDMTGQMIANMFSEDSIRKMVEANVFPEKALMPGDTWKRSFEQAAPPIGTMKFAVDNKFEDQEDHAGGTCARIAMVTKLTLESEESEDFPMTVNMDESGGKGTLWFDTKNGRMVELVQSIDMKMRLGPKSEDESVEHSEMEMTSKLSTRMLLLAKDAPALEQAGAKK